MQYSIENNILSPRSKPARNKWKNTLWFEGYFTKKTRLPCIIDCDIIWQENFGICERNLTKRSREIKKHRSRSQHSQLELLDIKSWWIYDRDGTAPKMSCVELVLLKHCNQPEQTRIFLLMWTRDLQQGPGFRKLWLIGREPPGVSFLFF